MQAKAKLGKSLGSGIHGAVFVATRNDKPGRFAVKIHRYREAFDREVAVYKRLTEWGVLRIRGCHIPAFLGSEPLALAIEMTIVSRPFALDFAGAYLDEPPEFSDEIWRSWRREKREQFEGDWPEVEAILLDLRLMGIHLHDISPTNISFRE